MDINDTTLTFGGGLHDHRGLPSPVFSDNEMVIVGSEKDFFQVVNDERASNQVVRKFWVGTSLGGEKNCSFVIVSGVFG